MKSKPSRRATSAVSVPAIATPSAKGHPDWFLLDLRNKLEKAWAEDRATIAKWKSDLSSEAEQECETSNARCSELVASIEEATASTLEGLRVKAFAVWWCHSGAFPIEFGDHPTTDVRLAQSIIHSLLMPKVPGS